MRKTKIICTLGPSTDDPEVLKQLMLNGMDVARVNMSHQDHDAQRVRIGAVKKLRAYHLLENKPVNVATAQAAISDIINNSQPTPVTVDKIIEEVARTYGGITPEDIRSQKRNANISKARQVSMYIVREITQMSMVEIGQTFGGRDHSTVVYAVRQVEKDLKKDPHTKAMVDDIIKNIRDR